MENIPSENQPTSESDDQSNMDCKLAVESAEVCSHFEEEKQNSKTENEDRTSRELSDIKTELLGNSEDDDLCFKALVEAEKNISNPVAGTSVDPSLSSTLRTIKKSPETEQKTKWSTAVMNQLNKVRRSNPRADLYAAEMFFPLSSWPSFMVELFVLNNIAHYSYCMNHTAHGIKFAYSFGVMVEPLKN